MPTTTKSSKHAKKLKYNKLTRIVVCCATAVSFRFPLLDITVSTTAIIPITLMSTMTISPKIFIFLVSPFSLSLFILYYFFMFYVKLYYFIKYKKSGFAICVKLLRNYYTNISSLTLLYTEKSYIGS